MNQHAPAHHFDQKQPDDSIVGDEAGINIEAEQSVLGAILHNNAALQSMPFLEADYFSHPVHRDLFAAIRSKVDGSRIADAVTLIAEFRGRKVDDMTGAQYIAALMANVVTILHARDHAICVLEAYATRLGIEKADEFVERLRTRRPDETITEIVGELEDDLASIRALSPKADTRTSLSAYCDGLLQKFSDQEVADRASIPFPLPEIASILQEDGFEPGNLYGLLASSGEGKTSLILQFARTAAEAGHPVLLLSFDQNGMQVVRQMASQATGITLGQMKRRNGMNEREWGIYMQEEGLLRKLPMEVVRLRQEKIGRICGQARAFAKRWSTRTSKAPLIILDHNRKVTPDRPNDHEGRIAGAINGAGKSLAEEIGAAVLYIMQRNGGGLRREVPRPIAADLFGGEGAREDFDGILYLYRAQKWRDERLKVAGSEQERIKIRDRFKLNGDDPENKAELGAIKVRYGDDSVREIVAWEGRLTRYVSARTVPKELPF